MPVINSIGVAQTPHAYTQEELFTALGHRKIYWPVFGGAGIERRPLMLSPEEMVRTQAQDVLDNYKKFSVQMAEEAARKCMEGASVNFAHIEQITLVSCTGMLCPPVSTFLVKNLGIPPWVVNTPVVGTGCQGASPGIRRVWDYLRVSAAHHALLVAVEISNACYHPNPDNDMGVYLGNALFSDGAACALVSGGGRGLTILDCIHYTDTEYIDRIGLDWVEARLKLRLKTDVPTIVAELLKKVAQEALRKADVKADQVAHWIVHSGGASILREAEQALEVPKEKLKYSWKIWREYGNMSSATVLYALKELMDSGELKKNDYVLMLTAGAGIEVGATLMYWGGNE